MHDGEWAHRIAVFQKHRYGRHILPVSPDKTIVPSRRFEIGTVPFESVFVNINMIGAMDGNCCLRKGIVDFWQRQNMVKMAVSEQNMGRRGLFRVQKSDDCLGVATRINNKNIIFTNVYPAVG
jgi:hypothetical protein